MTAGGDQAGQAGQALFCPTCLRRVPPERTTRRGHREAGAAGSIRVWVISCAVCGLDLTAQVEAEPEEPEEPGEPGDAADAAPDALREP